MTLVVNGEQRTVDDHLAVSGLVSLLGLDTSRLAVEVNRTIVRRGDWDTTRLSEGDRIEIVQFVGGGAA
ncbi:MAG TPA: sulfur carrier protein ThiS [Blastocatellia bacterium]|nr:sulfur carrier protein ThiS [Blastocatellia bacterium]